MVKWPRALASDDRIFIFCTLEKWFNNHIYFLVDAMRQLVWNLRAVPTLRQHDSRRLLVTVTFAEQSQPAVG